MKIQYDFNYLSEDYIFLISKLYQLDLYNSNAAQIAKDITEKINLEISQPELIDIYRISAICQAVQQVSDKEKAKTFLDEMYKLYPDLLKSTIAVYVLLLSSLGQRVLIKSILDEYKQKYGETDLFLRTELNYLFENGYDQNVQRIETIISKLKSLNN